MREQIYQAAIRQMQQDRQRAIGRRAGYSGRRLGRVPSGWWMACEIAGEVIVLAGAILLLIGLFSA